MRNLFLTLALLATVAASAQEELVRLQIGFDECGCLWEETDQSHITWEVGGKSTSCWEMSKTLAEKPHLTEEHIASQIEASRDRTNLYEGSFMLWFPVYEYGIYHIGVRNNITGELIGNTVVRVGSETVYLIDTYGDWGFVAYPHDFRLIQLSISDENTQWCGGGCDKKEYYPGDFVPN